MTRFSARTVASTTALAAGLFVSIAGDEVLTTGAALRVDERYAPTVTGLLFGLAAVAAIVGSALGGRLADSTRHQRRALLRLLVLAGLVTCAALVNDSAITIVAVCTLVTGLGAALIPLTMVLLRQFGDSEAEARLFETLRSGAAVTSPAVGGVVFAASGFGPVVVLDVVSYGLAAMLIQAAGTPRRAATATASQAAGKEPEDQRPGNVPGPSPRWYRLPELYRPVITMSVVAFVGAGATTALVHHVGEVAGARAYGVIAGLWAAGTLAGASVLSRYVTVAAWPLGLAFCSVVPVMGLASSSAVIGAACVLAGALSGVISVRVRATVQEKAPPGGLGRAHGAIGACINTCFVTGLLAGGALIASTRSSVAFSILGGAGIIALVAAQGVTLIDGSAGDERLQGTSA